MRCVAEPCPVQGRQIQDGLELSWLFFVRNRQRLRETKFYFTGIVIRKELDLLGFSQYLECGTQVGLSQSGSDPNAL